LAEVQQFIRDFDSLFEGKLSSYYNYSRVVSLAWLHRKLQALGLTQQDSVGVVSGSLGEPELKLLKSTEVRVLSFQNDPRYDLDQSWAGQPPADFSFTMCNQVLEHVFNPHQAFRNLIHHARRPGGLIFVSIPTVNCIHGEPHFYSSGFHPRFLERLARTNDLDVVGISCWGTPKYLLHAVTGVWATNVTLKPGFHGMPDCRFPNLVYSDGRDPSDAFARSMQFGPVITDCWGLFVTR
jgi:hypothetical protein